MMMKRLMWAALVPVLLCWKLATVSAGGLDKGGASSGVGVFEGGADRHGGSGPQLIVPASLGAPENSLEAFAKGFLHPDVYGVSTRIHRTKDGVFVCCEDMNTRRLTGISRSIRKSRYSELAALDFGRSGGSTTPVRLTRLEDVLRIMPPDRCLFLEVPLHDWGAYGTYFEECFYDYQFISALDTLLKRCELPRQSICIVSPAQWVLRDFRISLPGIRTLLLCELLPKGVLDKDFDRGNKAKLDFRSIQEKLRTADFWGAAVRIHGTDLLAAEIALLRERGQKLCLWEMGLRQGRNYLAAAMADYIRLENPSQYHALLPTLQRQAASFRTPARRYGVVPAYDPATLPLEPSDVKRNPNPYAGIDWSSVEQIHTTSHAHCEGGVGLEEWLTRRPPNPMRFVTLCNYYPAVPYYPFEKINRKNYFVVHHQHELARHGKVVPGPFDWNRILAQWQEELPEEARKQLPFTLGGQRFSIARLPQGIPEAPNAEHTGLSDSRRHVCGLGSLYASGTFDRTGKFGLRKHGFSNETGQPWRVVFSKIFQQLLIPDGGGVVIAHPHYHPYYASTVPELITMLDMDARVLGIEIFNLNSVEGGTPSCGWADDYWDHILSTGRQCFAFAVPDHCNWRGGHNVLLVKDVTAENCLRAYRQGQFYCAVWGQFVRFTRISYEQGRLMAEVDRPATMKIMSRKGLISQRKNTRSIELDMTLRDRYDDVFLRVEAQDETGDQIFSQPIMVSKL